MGILGSITSALFGGPKKRETTDSTSTTNESGTQVVNPYAPTIPYLNDYLASASALFNGGAPQISPYEQAGYDKLAQVAGSSPALDPAIKANNATLSGKYLSADSNPYIADIAQRSAGLAGAQSAGEFEGAGRTGSGLAGYYAGKGAADAANDVFYQNYGDERNRMTQAVGMAPSLEEGRYLAPSALISAGQQISARPYDIASQYGNILGNIAGLGRTTNSNQTSTTTGQSNDTGYTSGLLGKIGDFFANKLFPSS